MPNKKSSLGLIGYGRFGVLLATLLSRDFELIIHDSEDRSLAVAAAGFHWGTLEQVMRQETVFLAVPIRTFPALLQEIRSLTHPGQILVDVASVKTCIRDWMLETLAESVGILNTHPMFGPDSWSLDPDPRIVFCPTRIDAEKAAFWRDLFRSWSCRVIQLSVEEHDRLAARSQGITHFVGRIMKDMQIRSTEMDTQGFRQIHSVVEQTCQDSDELFHDLEFYNPYTPDMLRDFSQSVRSVKTRIFDADIPVQSIGYQGIPGSFSEEASLSYIASEGLGKIHCKACLSSQGVMDSLEQAEIQLGIIAMENARGGVVHESIHALAGSRCRVRSMFQIQVNQCLIGLPGLVPEKISEIHSHPQALKQCSRFLEQQFPGIPQIEAEDTAEAARKLRAGDYPETVAVIAAARAATLYGLQVLESGIQDLSDNKTLFLVIEPVSASN